MHQTPLADRIDQIDAMRMGVEYAFTINLRAFKMVCRPLSIGETNDVASTVAQRMASLSQFERQRLTEHTILAFETLKIASTPEGGTSQVSDVILNKCTPDELHFLFKQYVVECDKVDPGLDFMKPAALKALVEEVKKSPPEEWASQVTALSFSELASMCLAYLRGD